MADPYYRYAAPPETAGSAAAAAAARSSFPGYLSSEAPSLLSSPTFPNTDFRSYSSDFLQRDIPLGSGPYATDDVLGKRARPDPVLGASERYLGYGTYATDDKLGSGARPDSVVGASAGYLGHGTYATEDKLGSRARPDSVVGVSAGYLGHGTYATDDILGSRARPDPVLGGSARYLERGTYATDDILGSRARSDPVLGASAGTSLYDPLEAPSYRSQRPDVPMRSMVASGYGVDAVGVSVRAEPGVGTMVGTSTNGHPSPLKSQILPSQQEAAVSTSSSVSTDVRRERSASLRNGDGLPVRKGESNLLFVDGLPTDCTRREVGHIFRPFIGFKEIRVVHKMPRRSGDKAMVLCFVEFADPNCALTAMEALQGYKFDDKKPDCTPLKIQFAHFPFRPPSDSDEKRIEIPR